MFKQLWTHDEEVCLAGRQAGPQVTVVFSWASNNYKLLCFFTGYRILSWALVRSSRPQGYISPELQTCNLLPEGRNVNESDKNRYY